MTAWLALDADLRTALVALGGVLLGAFVNWAASSLAYEPRHFSPWSRRHPRDDRSPWPDRLPVIGWFLLRRKASQLGRGFWIRPLAVELFAAAACGGLYAWEVVYGRLLPFPPPPIELTPEILAQPAFAVGLHYQFAAHVLLLTFMLAASLIDLDEMIIPDSITVSGTLLGLTLVTLAPWSLLPIPNPRIGLDVLRATYGYDPQPLEQGFPNGVSLLAAAGCYLLWCGGLSYRPWRTSRGYGVAWRLLVRRMRQDEATPRIALLTTVGVALIGIVWFYERVCWIGLTSSLVGLAVGGAVVWITRVIGAWALGREAMGFGDVTLMAMVGSLVGWQAAVLIFFAAPVAALAMHGTRWAAAKLLGRAAFEELPYGPYLCLAAAAVVVAWRSVWEVAEPRFAVPWLVPIVLVVGFALLAGILWLLQRLRSA